MTNHMATSQDVSRAPIHLRAGAHLQATRSLCRWGLPCTPEPLSEKVVGASLTHHRFPPKEPGSPAISPPGGASFYLAR